MRAEPERVARWCRQKTQAVHSVTAESSTAAEVPATTMLPMWKIATQAQSTASAPSARYPQRQRVPRENCSAAISSNSATRLVQAWWAKSQIAWRSTRKDEMNASRAA